MDIVIRKNYISQKFPSQRIPNEKTFQKVVERLRNFTWEFYIKILLI